MFGGGGGFSGGGFGGFGGGGFGSRGVDLDISSSIAVPFFDCNYWWYSFGECKWCPI